MARPKTGRTRVYLNLSVTPETRDQLRIVAEARHTTISAIVAEFADREYRRYARDRKRADIAPELPGQLGFDVL